MTKDCFAHGCTRQVHVGKLMCLPHWNKVSTDTKTLVYKTWQTYQKHAGPVERQAYMAARDQAAREVTGV